ncbi:MAG: DNA gyrase inhibitor YacG [Mangrovicoccus sp.]
MSCPICSKPAMASYRPFCSKRCADVDLGRWLTEGYALPGEDEAVEEENSPNDEKATKTSKSL